MVYIEYDETGDKAKFKLDGCLGLIFAELGIVIVQIANNKELEMTTDDVLEAIKETIEYNKNNSFLVLDNNEKAEAKNE